tara:strand:- start:165 stop:365 length:201 start_codon:yes stop_codon:yes gene_type:complete
MLKVSLNKFLAVAGLNPNSDYAARKLFANSPDLSFNGWDRAMKKANVYDETLTNVAKAIEFSKKSK